MMIILDTNVLSELIKLQGSTLVRNWVSRQPVTSLFTTTITQAEILYGIAILPEGKRKYELYQAATLMFVEDFVGRVLPSNISPIPIPKPKICLPLVGCL
jgi:predicted nucleic acid-binding protein